MLRTITLKEGTPTADLYNQKGAGKKRIINGILVWMKGQSITGSDSNLSPYNERAAYLVDKMLNLGLVPTTVLRLVDGKLVSAQKWVNGSIPKGVKPPLLCLFDYLIHNTDRHEGNWLVERDSKVWAIDNAYSFYNSDYYRSEMWFWQDLSAMDKAKLRKRLQLVLTEPQKIHKQLDYLIGKNEVSALISRMERVLNIDKEVDANEVTD